LCHWDFSLT